MPTERSRIVLTARHERIRIETLLSHVQRHAPTGWRLLYVNHWIGGRGHLDGSQAVKEVGANHPLPDKQSIDV